MANYSYPIETDWTIEEMTAAINLMTAVEEAYETGTSARNILDKYKIYKKYFVRKNEERQLSRQFEQVSGYSIYKAIKAAQSNPEQKNINIK